MYQYDVLWNNRQVGTAQAEQQGLYWRVCVRCELPEGIYRVCAHNVDAQAKLGVLCPASEQMALEKRLSCSSFHFYPDTVLTLGEAPWWKHAGLIDGWELPGAKVHEDELVVPYQKDAPFVCMPLFCFFRLITRQGRQYWQMALDADGRPKMPEPA